jgi:hypothetical protein
MGKPHYPESPAIPDAPSARHLGDLVRGQIRWSVYLESRRDGELVEGRIHFVDGSRRCSTGWMFREWTEKDILDRFHDFSPIELWKLLDSIQ